MSHDSLICVTVRCGDCFVPARDLAGPRHWPSLTAAVAELSGPPWGWSATLDTQICGTCLARQRCRSVDHDWGSWTEIPDLGLEEDLLLRVCERCGLDQVVAADCLGRPSTARRSA
jgi:hypothetical protein